MDWQPVISVQQQTPDNDFCHFSISNVPFAFWAFFSKTGKTRVSHRVEMMTRCPGDPDVKDDPNDPLTRWPNDPVPCLVSSYPCFILYILSKLDQTTDIHLSGLSSRAVSTWGDLTVSNDELFRTRPPTPSGLVQSSESSTDCRLRPRCCHLGSYFKRPKSSLVHPFNGLQLVLQRTDYSQAQGCVCSALQLGSDVQQPFLTWKYDVIRKTGSG